MNIENIKQNINDNLGKKVLITVYGIRNKTSKYTGTLYKTYQNIFSIILDNKTEKSFSYNDYIIGEIKIKYL